MNKEKIEYNGFWKYKRKKKGMLAELCILLFILQLITWGWLYTDGTEWIKSFQENQSNMWDYYSREYYSSILPEDNYITPMSFVQVGVFMFFLLISLWILMIYCLARYITNRRFYKEKFEGEHWISLILLSHLVTWTSLYFIHGWTQNIGYPPRLFIGGAWLFSPSILICVYYGIRYAYLDTYREYILETQCPDGKDKK